jgi:beta-galactosidase
VMFTRRAAEGVASFVRSGGYVLAEARLAWNDERGYAADVIPGLGLSEVFGVREGDIWMREEVLLKISDASHPAATHLKAGETLKGNLYAESIQPLEGRAVRVIAELEDGLPAIVSSQYGMGETILVGSYLGMAGHPEAVETNDRFYLSLLDWAKIDRPFTTSHDGNRSQPVEVRLQENSDGYLVFVINHSTGTEDVTVTLQVSEDGSYAVKEIISGAMQDVTARDHKLTLTTSVASKHVHVWSIRHMRR